MEGKILERFLKGDVAMVYRGIVKQGKVVIEEGITLPEGQEVRVEPIAEPINPDKEGPTLAEQFQGLIGVVPELPPDMADRHDAYLHGAANP